jgi:hypothetical protein
MTAYWNGNGAEQAKYNEMCAAGFDDHFTKASMEDMHRYYRYYNDGDLPGWARSRYDLKTWNPNHYGGWTPHSGAWELNAAGEAELERRATAVILKEWARYQKMTAKQK